MLKKLVLFTTVGLVVICGLASAAPPKKQQFHADVSGAIEADLLTGTIKSADKQKLLAFQDCTPMCVPFVLGDFWQDQAYEKGVEGSDCFPVGDVYGAIHMLETKSGEAMAKFWFDSAGVTYLLTLTTTAAGWQDSELSHQVVFPPTEIYGDSAYMAATHWEMETEGKGKLRKTSCKGMGSFTGEDAVLLIVQKVPIDP